MSGILKVLLNCPKHWVSHPLGDLCKVVGGSTPDTGVAAYWGGDVTWVTPYDLGRLDGPYITGSSRTISQYGLRNCSAEIAPMGSVVLSSRAPIGYVGVAGTPLATNQGCKSFIPGPSIDSFYLYYLLLFMKPLLQELGSGATFAEVSKSTLSGLLVPLPPLSEQKRIVAILNEQMAAVEKARAAAEAQLEAAKALPAAYLREVFTLLDEEDHRSVSPGRGESHGNWSKGKLGDLCRVVGGSTPNTGICQYWGGSIAWVTPADLGQLTAPWIAQTQRYITPQGLGSCSAEILPTGSVVLSSRAPIGYLGITTVPMTTNQGCKSFIPGPDIDSEYLYYMLHHLTPSLKKMGSGATFAEVSKSALAALEVSVPPFHEQKRIVANLNVRMKATTELIESTESQLSCINALPGALLRQAFSGAL